MILRHPEGYLHEYTDALEKEFQITLSKSALSRFLTDKNINRKQVALI